jgi:hypothetical protein
MCKEIPLSRGLVALVDDADYEPLTTGHKWFASPHRNTFYAKRMTTSPSGNRSTEYLHRLLLPDAPRIDHCNGNGLDNQRANLRVATGSQNQINRGLDRTNSTGFKGISFHRKTGLWHACLIWQGVKRSGQYHATPEDAARAYDALVRQHAGEYGRYNFPQSGERGVRHA